MMRHLSMRMLLLVLLMVLGSLAGPALSALDQLDTWDDLSGYGTLPQTITASNSASFAGGDGWNTTSEVGWEVSAGTSNPSPPPAPTALLANGSLQGTSGGNLETVGGTFVQRVFNPLTPTASQPLWISFVLEPEQTSVVSGDDVACSNVVQFYGGGWVVGNFLFSLNTQGTRVDGSSSLGQALRWRLNQDAEAASTTLQVADGTAKLVVLEVQTTALSLWIYPNATPSSISASNPMEVATLTAVPTFDRVQFGAATDYTQNPAAVGSLRMDNFHIGTSLLAVTSSGMPHVTSVTPASANNAGGDTVLVAGTNFGTPASVSFATVAAPTVTVTSATSLSAVVPMPVPGTFTGVVDLVVANDVGQVLHPRSFTYTNPTTSDPALNAPPTISASNGLQSGSTLTAFHGVWSPTPSGYAYDWQTSTDGTSFHDLGATASTYQVVPADAGTYLRVVVTPTGSAINAASAAVLITTATIVAGEGPVVSGDTAQGDQLLVTTGTWQPVPSGFTYQWNRSPVASGAGGVAISDATSNAYTVTAADFGSFLFAVVTADGTTSMASSNVVAIDTPRAISPPTMSGSFQPGGVVAAQPGTWVPAPSGFTYQWRLQLINGGPFDAIPGATGSTYQIPSGDLGDFLSVVVAVAGAPALNAGATPVQISYQKQISTYVGAQGTVGSQCGLSAGLGMVVLGLGLGWRRRRAQR